MTAPMKHATTDDRELVISRLINAPRELVFKVWTDPNHVDKWWGPRGFSNTTHAMEVKPGGIWRYTMHYQDGTNYPNRVVFQEVVAPERLVYLHGNDDEEISDQFHVTVTFDEQDRKTLLTMRMVFATVEAYEQAKSFGATEGGQSTLERLEEYVTTL